ncbi:trans-sialidase [Trypanosoma cruzi]|nr:trans-sialidase [Trypanosoma cruzi]
MHIAVDLNAPFVVHAGSCVWRLLSSSVAMRRREEESECAARVSFPAGVVHRLCLRCVDAVSWCVNCAAGPAALSSCCLLSLAVSAALRPSPFCSIPFPSGSRIS